jgi:hypothetical protein
MPSGIPKVRVSPEDFVVVWNTSKTVREVVERTGMSFPAVRTRARNYRKKGVKLTDLTSHLSRIERVQEIRRLADSTAEVWDIETALKRYPK